MIGRRAASLLVAGLLAACPEAPRPIAPIAESGELVVLTVNGPLTYFEDAQGLPSGFEYDLISLFAKSLDGLLRSLASRLADANREVPI